MKVDTQLIGAAGKAADGTAYICSTSPTDSRNRWRQPLTQTPTPDTTQTQTKPAAVKYKNCSEAKAAGVTPILKATDPELYALNAALDGDKDGDACES